MWGVTKPPFFPHVAGWAFSRQLILRTIDIGHESRRQSPGDGKAQQRGNPVSRHSATILQVPKPALNPSAAFMPGVRQTLAPSTAIQSVPTPSITIRPVPKPAPKPAIQPVPKSTSTRAACLAEGEVLEIGEAVPWHQRRDRLRQLPMPGDSAGAFTSSKTASSGSFGQVATKSEYCEQLHHPCC